MDFKCNLLLWMRLLIIFIETCCLWKQIIFMSCSHFQVLTCLPRPQRSPYRQWLELQGQRIEERGSKYNSAHVLSLVSLSYLTEAKTSWFIF